jgi:hypothetical protein
MGADNWTQCPRCYTTNRAKADELDEGVRTAYGKVTESEFNHLRDSAFSFRKSIGSDHNFSETLREDYEIGIHNGEFSVDYRAHCNVCGFVHTLKQTDAVK